MRQALHVYIERITQIEDQAVAGGARPVIAVVGRDRLQEEQHHHRDRERAELAVGIGSSPSFCAISDAPSIDLGVVPIEFRLRHQDDVEDVFKGERERERQHEFQHAAERAARDHTIHMGARNRGIGKPEYVACSGPRAARKILVAEDMYRYRSSSLISPCLLPNFRDYAAGPDRCTNQTKKPLLRVEERNYQEGAILTASQKRMKRHSNNAEEDRRYSNITGLGQLSLVERRNAVQNGWDRRSCQA